MFPGNDEKSRLQKGLLRVERQVGRVDKMTHRPSSLIYLFIHTYICIYIYIFIYIYIYIYIYARVIGMSKNGLDNDDGDSSEEEAPVVLSDAQGKGGRERSAA